MEDMLKCSVVIPSYNRVNLLRYSLESLTKQRLHRDQFEVIVVDDGSSDGTADMVNGYRERLNLRYFFRPDEGYTASKARNVGIANARADICVLIDSGVLLHSGCLEAHVGSHYPDPLPIAVCGYTYGYHVNDYDNRALIREINTEDPDATIHAMAEKGIHLDLREHFYKKYTDHFNHLPAPWVIFWTSNVSVRTSQLRAVGGFDEAFLCWGGEDMDLGYRLHRDGAKFMVNRQASAIHYPHEKDFHALQRGAMENYRHMVRKYGRTPIISLILELPNVDPFNMNDVIRERKLPACADYLLSQQRAGQ